MKTTSEHEAMREDLMNGAINATAKYGLVNLTTKIISQECGLNEAYIYRYFIDKEDLLEKTFVKIDTELFNVLTEYHYVFNNTEKSYKEKAREYFDLCWTYLGNGKKAGIFYIRYYNSAYFDRDKSYMHQKLAEEFQEKISDNLKKSGTKVFLHAMFNLVLSYALDIALQKVENTPTTQDEIFELLYCMVEHYSVDKN